MTTVLTEERIIERIKDIIDCKCHLKENNDGTYEGEIYADYRDNLEQHTIKKIFDSDNPGDAFYEVFDDSSMYATWDEQDELFRTIKENFDDDDEEIYISDYEDSVRDWIVQNVYYNFPYQHFLNQDVRVDIILDTGDGNFDFTENELFGCIYQEKGYRPESSVILLMKQQGYTEAQIIRFIENEDFQDSKFLKSVYDECINTTTCMNALSFFVTMTLEECLDLHEALNSKEKAGKSIVIEKGTPCGLYDPWGGAGSILEIETEKDVVVPIEFVSSAMPDGCRGYGVDEIYGMIDRFWKSDCVKIMAGEVLNETNM